MHLDDRSVSTQHARLFVGAEGAEIEDAGSRFGTFIGEQRIETRRAVPEGEVIWVGNWELRLSVAPAAQPATLRVWEGRHAAQYTLGGDDELSAAQLPAAHFASLQPYLPLRLEHHRGFAVALLDARGGRYPLSASAPATLGSARIALVEDEDLLVSTVLPLAAGNQASAPTGASASAGPSALEDHAPDEGAAARHGEDSSERAMPSPPSESGAQTALSLSSDNAHETSHGNSQGLLTVLVIAVAAVGLIASAAVLWLFR